MSTTKICKDRNVLIRGLSEQVDKDLQLITNARVTYRWVIVKEALEEYVAKRRAELEKIRGTFGKSRKSDVKKPLSTGRAAHQLAKREEALNNVDTDD